MKSVVVLIPCRSGSKTLLDKNIKLYRGLPLFVHSIKVAQELFSNKEFPIYVSTDSFEYQKIAIQYGAKAPFLRPSEISGDLSTDLDVFHHFLEYYITEHQQYPDLIIHLRPTYPNRTKELLKSTLNTLLDNYDDYDSLRTVIPLDKSLFKMYYIENNRLCPSYKTFNGIDEPYNQPRQILPCTYLHNGSVDIIKSKTILEQNSMTGHKIFPYIMNKDELYDIDTLEDFVKSERSNLKDQI